MAAHWLIVWGTAVDHVREGTGDTPATAANEAFGVGDKHAVTRMTFMQCTLGELRSDSRRTKKIVDLLRMHRRNPGMNDEERSTVENFHKSIDKEIAQIERMWGHEWERQAARAEKARAKVTPKEQVCPECGK